MNVVLEFFGDLFSISNWPPRWRCGDWSSFHGWLTILSDLTIWLAYFVIPVILLKLTQTIKTIPFLPVFWLFGAFIILCGFTHLMDAIIFWWPAYRFGTLVKLATAIVSLGTVFALLRVLPKMINFKPTKEEASNDEEELLQRDQQITELNKKVLEKDIEIDRMKIEIIRLKNNMNG